MRVFVFNMRGEPLMPCTQRKARLLLKAGKAKIYKYNPFTIQLKYATGENKQECHVGIDTGSKHIGLAVTSENKGRKEPNRIQKRNSKNTPYYRGFYLNDKVSVFGKSGYITGFTNSGAYVKGVDGEYIVLPNKSYKRVNIASLKFICHNNNWQYITKNAV